MSADVYFTPPERIVALHAIRDAHSGESGQVQKARLLAAIQQLGSVSTYEAMRFLDIYDPRPRKFDLVRDGHDIVTTRRASLTESEQRHSVGVYSMKRAGPAPQEL